MRPGLDPRDCQFLPNNNPVAPGTDLLAQLAMKSGRQPLYEFFINPLLHPYTSLRMITVWRHPTVAAFTWSDGSQERKT